MRASKALAAINEVNEDSRSRAAMLYFGRDLIVFSDTSAAGSILSTWVSVGQRVGHPAHGIVGPAAFAGDAIRSANRPIRFERHQHALRFRFCHQLVGRVPGTVSGTVRGDRPRAGRRQHTAVQAPGLPLPNAGQLSGLMGGMKGGAEYEQITDMKAKAAWRWSPDGGPIFVVLFIVIGTGLFFDAGQRQEAGPDVLGHLRIWRPPGPTIRIVSLLYRITRL
jgi:hypothetical protein